MNPWIEDPPLPASHIISLLYADLKSRTIY
jgi:hypothetical protein